MAISRAGITQILSDSMNKIFEEEYSKYTQFEYREGYILEQCGKKWRVKHTKFGVSEYKTDFLPYKEAEALLKIFKSGEDDGNS